MAGIDDRLNRAVKTAQKQDRTKRNTQQDTYFKVHPGEHTLKAPKESFRARIAKAFSGGMSAPSVKGISAGEIGPINHTDPVAGYLNVNTDGSKKKTAKLGRMDAIVGQPTMNQAAQNAENAGTALEGVARGLDKASRRKASAELLLGPVNHLDPVAGYMGVDDSGKKKQQLSGMDLKKASKKVMKAADKAYEYSDIYHADQAKYRELERKGMGKVGRAAMDVADMVGDVAGDMTAGAINPALGTARMALRSSGQAGYEARKKGNASYAGRAAYSAAMGGLGVAMSKIGNVTGMLKGAYGKGVLDSIGATGAVDDAVNELVKSATGRAALKAAGAAGTQALYTNLQDRITPVIERATGVDKSAQYNSRDAVKNAAMSAIMGFITATPELVHGVGSDIKTGRENSADAAANRVYQGYDENGIFSPKTEAQKELTQESADAYGKAGYRFGKENSNRIEWVKPPEGKSETPVLDAVKNKTEQQSETPVLDAVTGKAHGEEDAQSAQTEKNAPEANVHQSADKQATKAQEIADLLTKGKRVETSNLDADTFDRVAETGAAIDASGKAYIPNPEEHIDARTMENVGTRNVNAFQFDHPELHGYFQEAAKDLMSDADISNSLPNNAQKSRTLGGKSWDHSAMTSPSLRDAMDETGLSRADIIDAAQRLVEDHGQENVAAAKRLELVLDGMLTHGYETMDGRSVEANAAYLKAKQGIPGYAEAEQGGHLLDDIDPDGTQSVGAAKGGFTTEAFDHREKVSKSAEEMPYNKQEEYATAMKRDEYQKMFKYNNFSEAESTHAAEEMVYYRDQNGEKKFIGDIDPQALSDIQKELRDAPAWNNVMTDSAKMIRQELMGKSVNGEITSEEYADWVRTVVDHERETGRGVQAVSKWSRRDDASTQADAIKALDKNTTMTDQQRSDAFQKIVKWDYAVDNAKPGDLDTIKSTILDIAKDRGTVSNAFTGKTSRRLERAAMKSLDGLTFDELKAFAHASSSAYAEDYTPAGIGQKIKTIQVLNMLSKPATAGRNLVGNTSFYGIDAMSMDGASLLDMALSKITGTRSVAFEKPSLFNAESREAFKRSVAEVALDVDMSGDTSRYGTSSNRTFKMSGNIKDRFLSVLERNMGYLLTSTDEFYLGAGRSTEKGTQALIDSGKIKGVSPDYASEQASRLADYRTFHDNSKTSDMIQSLHDSLNMIGFGDSGRKTMHGNTIHSFGLGDIAAPFTKVAGNLVSRAKDYSVFNAVKGVVEIGQCIADAAGKRGVNPEKQAGAVSDFARGLNGVALTAGFAALAKAGLLKHADDEDDDDVASLNQSEGMTGTQLNLTAATRFLSGGNAEWKQGDKLLDLSAIEPLNVLMNLGAKLAAPDEEDKNRNIVTRFGAETADSMVQASSELPVLQGLGALVKGAVYKRDMKEELAQQAANTLVSSFIPNALYGIAQGTDGYIRNAYSSGTMTGNIVDAAKNKIPVLRETLPAAVNGMGKEKQYSGGFAQRIVNSLVNPAGINTYAQGDVSSEMQRLRKATGDASFYPSKSAPNKINVNKQIRTLDGNQKLQYQRVYGTEIETEMRGVMATAQYRNASDAEKVTMLQKCREMAADIAANRVAGRALPQWVGKVQNSDVPLSVYVMYKNAWSNEKDAGKKAYEANAAVRQKILADDSLTVDQKNQLDDMLIHDLTIIPQDKDVNYSSAETFKVSQMTDSAQRHYSAVKNTYGLSADAFSKAWSIYHDNSLHAAEKRQKIAQVTGKNGYALYKEFGKRR